MMRSMLLFLFLNVAVVLCACQAADSKRAEPAKDESAAANAGGSCGSTPEAAATDTCGGVAATVAATEAPAASDALPRRTGVVARGSSPLTLIGPELNVGDLAPPWELVDTAMKPFASRALAGELVVINVVPSLDTPVCEIQTGTLLSRLAEMPEGTRLVTISRDLPFAQRRFLEHKRESMPIPDHAVVLSDFRDATFGRTWGILVDESGLLARSVWVIGRDGRIAYRELVRDQSQEPDYDALIEALR